MPKKSKLLSLNEEVIQKGNEIVGAKVEIQNFSHLVETLILKDYASLKRGKKQ